jgi:hypothetical protein
MYRYASLVSLLPLVAAHGYLSSPPGRGPGDNYRATCGDQPFYQQSSDINGNIQGIQQVVGNSQTEDCNLWLCKGFLLEDNPDLVQTYSLGETIDIRVNIAAPHTGYANVSVVKTSTNSMIGNPLIEFQNYASNSGMAANNTAFSVTLPESLGGDCTTAGDCVLQWFWDAPDIDQTYEACADFVVAADGSGSGPSSTAAPASSAAPATSAAPVTTAPAPATATSVEPAPVPTTTAVPGNPDDEECPADDGDDEGEDEEEGEGEDNGDEECPVDGGEEPEEDDDNTEEGECPADDGEDEDVGATPTSSLGVKEVSTSAVATATEAYTSIVTQIVTSTVTTERLVTVTAAATACN